jgi:hypothetical protein
MEIICFMFCVKSLHCRQSQQIFIIRSEPRDTHNLIHVVDQWPQPLTGTNRSFSANIYRNVITIYLAFNVLKYLGIEVLPAVVVKIYIFWDITPCSPLMKVNWRFGGTCRLHLLYDLLSRWFLTWSFLRPWRWRRNIAPKYRLFFNGLHVVISHKIELLIKHHSIKQFKSCIRLIKYPPKRKNFCL